jgi:hypothetical protein
LITQPATFGKPVDPGQYGHSAATQTVLKSTLDWEARIMGFLTRATTCLGAVLLLAGAAAGASAHPVGQQPGMMGCPMMGMGPGMMMGRDGSKAGVRE